MGSDRGGLTPALPEHYRFVSLKAVDEELPESVFEK
jgi:hypothetical protein